MLFGDNTKPILTGFAVLMMSGIFATGIMVEQTWPYYTAAALAGVHLAWQVGSYMQACELYQRLHMSTCFFRLEQSSWAHHQIVW